MKPIIDIKSINELPGFTGDNVAEIKSYELSKYSPLIGKGTRIDDELKTDFFGNEITSNNIGCYGGNGVDVEYEKEGFFEKIGRKLRNTFETIAHEIAVIFD